MRVRGVILHDAAVQDSGCRRFGVPSLSASCLVLQHPKRGGGVEPHLRELCLSRGRWHHHPPNSCVCCKVGTFSGGIHRVRPQCESGEVTSDSGGRARVGVHPYHPAAETFGSHHSYAE